MKITLTDRILLALACLLTAWQVAVGIDGLDTTPMTAYTIGFGVLLVAGLLLLILGYEVLENPIVVIVSTIIPLSLSLGLVWEYIPTYRLAYALFAITGFLAVLITRAVPLGKIRPVIVVALVHGVAGLVITLLPVLLVVSEVMPLPFALVGLGGALIGVGGLLLSIIKTGRPFLAGSTLYRIFPALLLTITVCFVAGFTLS